MAFHSNSALYLGCQGPFYSDSFGFSVVLGFRGKCLKTIPCPRLSDAGCSVNHREKQQRILFKHITSIWGESQSLGRARRCLARHCITFCADIQCQRIGSVFQLHRAVEREDPTWLPFQESTLDWGKKCHSFHSCSMS